MAACLFFLATLATATNDAELAKVFAHSNACVATIAFTQPQRTFTNRAVILNDNQPAKSLPSHINAGMGCCDGNVDGIFERPAKFQSPTNDILRHSKFTAPFNYSLCFPLVGNPAIGATIDGLFGSRRPSTIGRRVSAVNVDTFNSVLGRWRFTHIGKETWELGPSFTDCNPTATVTSVSSGHGISAPLPNMLPCSVRFGANAVLEIGVAMLRYNVAMQASATALLASFQVIALGQTFIPANATTTPSDFYARIGGSSNYSQSSEDKTGQVNNRTHSRPSCRLTYQNVATTTSERRLHWQTILK